MFKWDVRTGLHSVQERIGLSIGAKDLVEPYGLVINDGWTFELTSKVPQARFDLEEIYKARKDALAAKMRQQDATEETVNDCVEKLSALQARKTAEYKALAMDEIALKTNYKTAVYRVPLAEQCEKKLVDFTVRGDGKVLSVDLAIKQNNTFEQAIAAKAESPTK